MKRFLKLFRSKRRKRESEEVDREKSNQEGSQEEKLNPNFEQEGKRSRSNSEEETKRGPFENNHFDSCSMMSSSEKWRKDGNKFYVSATPNVCSAVQEERLKKALQCYYRALEVAEGKGDYASAAKNYALTSWKLGDIAHSNCLISMMHHHHKEAVKHFVKAQEAGVASMNADWNINIGTRLQQCLQTVLETSTSAVNDTRKKMHMIEGFRNLLTENHQLLPDIHLFLAEIIFRGAVVAISSGLYKDALNYLRDANFPLEEGKRHSGDRIDVLEELRILEQDIYYQTCAAESLQACALGDELLKRAIETDETMNIDMIWDVIDWYKQGIVLTREKEVELEAMALSKLGIVYHKVLKTPQRAKENFLRCIQLAMSLHPRTFDDEEWFKEAKKLLEVHQNQLKREEDEKHQQERAKYLEELKDELEKLKKYENDEDIAFLKFVYVTWPPKKKDFKMDDLGSILEYSQKKKALQKAVILYHPDKVDVEEHGMKWKVLCEEIEKILTRKYEIYK